MGGVSCGFEQEQSMKLLTAQDLTANSILLPSALPSEMARWRSGYAEDCKSI